MSEAVVLLGRDQRRVPSLADSLGELAHYRGLLYMLTWRDIRARYKQSMMGFFWAVLMPLLIVGAGLLVRVAFSVKSGEHIPVAEIAAIALKSLPWAFFISAVKFGTNSMVSNPNLVTKIYFPREVFPLAAVLASLFDATIASSVVVLLLAIARVGVSWQLLWAPLLLLLIVVFTLAVAMLFSCANLFFRDVKYLVDVLLTFGIFFTPVFYDAHSLGKWAPLLLLNPLGTLLQSLSDVVIHHAAPSGGWLEYAAAATLGGLYCAWRIFDRAEVSFAESI